MVTPAPGARICSDRERPQFRRDARRFPVCIFGFSQHAEGIASVWLLGTDALVAPTFCRTFLREARRISDEWSATFGTIFNFVDVHAVTTRRWLGWLGFRESGVESAYGFAKTPFVRVTKTPCATP